MRNRTAWFFAGIIALSLIVYKGIDLIESSMTPLPVYGNEGHVVPPFQFTNQLDEVVTSDDLSDKIWIVNFFFTSCPTICPKMTRNLQTVHDFIRDDESFQLMSFTVDPKRDTPGRLKAYADNYRVNHDTWYFLTGDKKELYRLGNRGFLISTAEGQGDDLDFIHSENVVLVDLERKIRGYYNGTDPASMKTLLNDINKLKRSKA